MSADALSDVLRTVRLTGAAFFDIVATAPWVAEQPPRETAFGMVTVRMPSFRSALTSSTAIGSGSENARENRP